MGRLILILVVVVIAAVVILRVRNRARMGHKQKRVIGRDMVRCDYCGLHVPENEVLRAGERRYCSREHAAIDNKD